MAYSTLYWTGSLEIIDIKMTDSVCVWICQKHSITESFQKQNLCFADTFKAKHDIAEVLESVIVGQCPDEVNFFNISCIVTIEWHCAARKMSDSDDTEQYM